MMGEIIDHGYPTLFTFHFAAASHVLKTTQSLPDDVALNTPGVGRDDYCQTVEQIESAHQRRLESPPIDAFARNGKTTEVRREIRFSNAPPGIFSYAECFNLRKEFRTHRVDNIPNIHAVPSRNQPSVCGNQIHETPEREFYSIKIFVDIGVIKLDVINDADLRQVVHELRTLIEVSSVVFVSFDNKKVAVSHAKTDTEVLCDPSNQERWI